MVNALVMSQAGATFLQQSVDRGVSVYYGDGSCAEYVAEVDDPEVFGDWSFKTW